MIKQQSILLLVCLTTLQASLFADPAAGLANISYPQDSVFEIISYIPTSGRQDPGYMNNGLPDNPTYTAMMNGNVVVACDEGASVLDLTDPYNPEVLSTYWYDIGKAQPEYDNWGLTTGYGGIHTVRYDSSFLDFIDYTDPANPRKVSTVDSLLPCQLWRENGSHAGWGYPTAIAWQAPYLYSSMRNVGIDIIDVHDIENPVHVKRFANDGDKYRPGSIHAVGNLLIVAAYNWNGMGIWDISDPVNPVLLSWKGEGWKSPAHGWQVFVNGNKLYRSGEVVYVWDMTDPTDLKHITTYETNSGCTMDHGHCSSGGVEIQDGFLFLGGSHFGVYKWNLGTEELVGHSGPFHRPGAQGKHDYYDMDYPNVVGNFVVGASEDHFQGVFVIPHQAGPDNTPPEVNMVVPHNGETNQATTSRVGLTFTDAVDPASVTTETFIVRESGESALPGKYSMYKSIVNFCPDEQLEASKTYEVVVPAGGITDYMGNATAETFSSNFSTGDVVSVRPESVKRVGAGPRTAPSIQLLGTARPGFEEARDTQLFTIRGSRVPMNRRLSGSGSQAGVSRGVYVISGRQ
mgnify:CR=1 FL=1